MKLKPSAVGECNQNPCNAEPVKNPSPELLKYLSSGAREPLAVGMRAARDR